MRPPPHHIAFVRVIDNGYFLWLKESHYIPDENTHIDKTNEKVKFHSNGEKEGRVEEQVSAGTRVQPKGCRRVVCSNM